MAQPAGMHLVPETMAVTVWLIAVAAVIAVGIAAAVRFPTQASALAYRLGHAFGVAWGGLRALGETLLRSLRRMIE